jgi:hypothetical protein
MESLTPPLYISLQRHQDVWLRSTEYDLKKVLALEVGMSTRVKGRMWWRRTGSDVLLVIILLA